MSPRKNLLITGASSGIGAATALMAAARGWNIGIGYHSDVSGAQAVAAQAQVIGARTVLLPGNVGDPQDVARIFETCERGLGPLHGLVNNAGIVAPTSRLEDMPVDRLKSIVDVNLLGTIYCAQQAIRRMAYRHGGAGGVIVNISSVAAKLGAAGQYVDYAASKAAVDTLTIGLAQENAQEGIRINGIRPGIITSPIHAKGGEPGREDRIAPLVPLKRPGTPQEVAEAILWFLSDAASYNTGSILDVSGGR